MAIARQTELVLEQMKACLEAAGSSLSHVIKCQVYCTSSEHFGTVNEVYNRYFPIDPPARIFVRSRRFPDLSTWRSTASQPWRAGRLGVAITDALVSQEVIVEDCESFRVTEAGESRLAQLGVAVSELRRSGRPLCRWCLDWSERRPHLAGAVGARIASRSMEAGWVRRLEGSRAVQVTVQGKKAFADMLGLELRVTQRTA